jgi:hypothetical protein
MIVNEWIWCNFGKDANALNLQRQNLYSLEVYQGIEISKDLILKKINFMI